MIRLVTGEVSMGSHLASEVASIFEELDATAREELWVRTVIDRDSDHDRLRELQAETRADPVKRAKRRASQCRYVAEREQLDPAFKASRRARSRGYARELTEAREAARVDAFYDRGLVLPGLCMGVDVPAPVPARLKPVVEVKRKRHAEQERERRRKAKRVDSCPLLERCA